MSNNSVKDWAEFMRFVSFKIQLDYKKQLLNYKSKGRSTNARGPSVCGQPARGEAHSRGRLAKTSVYEAKAPQEARRYKYRVHHSLILVF